jgi:hypothetical protein
MSSRGQTWPPGTAEADAKRYHRTKRPICQPR